MGMSDYFIFDDIDTRNYEGISVYFDEVDTTPKRVGEFIEIPNRNGSFFLDGGRYEDVTHTYDVIALSKNVGRNLINALASKVGHFRLTDSFNSDEYYSAVLDAEIEPTITTERDKLTFKVIFTRKPQRWLTSGETAVTVSSGGTLTNPTLFESSPLLEVEGYGTIGFNGYEIEYAGDPYGEIVLASETWASSADNPYTKRFLLGTSLLNVGDAIYSKAERYLDGYFLVRPSLSASRAFTNLSVGATTNVAEARIGSASNSDIFLYVYIDAGSFVYGTSKTISSSASFNYAVEDGPIYTEQVQATIAYDGADAITVTTTRTGTVSAEAQRGSSQALMPTMYGNSSKTASGPIFIDCDLGEAYVIENDVYISMNHYIDLGSDLPKLASGSNTVTFDNTITKLKVTPRWWKV